LWYHHSPSVHGATKNVTLQHLHSNQPLDNHGGAKLTTTWHFMMASFLLAQTWKNILKTERKDWWKNSEGLVNKIK